MLYNHDPLLDEIHQIRRQLWEESGHDAHKMIEIIEQEAREVIRRYKEISVAPKTEEGMFVHEKTTSTKPS